MARRTSEPPRKPFAPRNPGKAQHPVSPVQLACMAGAAGQPGNGTACPHGDRGPAPNKRAPLHDDRLQVSHSAEAGLGVVNGGSVRIQKPQSCGRCL